MAFSSSRIVELVALLLAAALVTGGVHASVEYCKPEIAELLCTTAPRLPNGQYDYNMPDQSQTKPWVMGYKNRTSAAPGEYFPPNANFVNSGQYMPMIWVVDDAILEIVGNGDNEVIFAAWIVLCDRAQFRIVDSSFRYSVTQSFQYSIWAAGNSHIFYSGANVTAIAQSIQNANPSASGHFGLHWIRSNATITVTKSVLNPGFGLRSRRGMGLDAWEIAVMEYGRANISDALIFAEWYSANRADVTIRDSRYFDYFFEICPQSLLPGFTYQFPPLPTLCDFPPYFSGGSVPPCLGPTQQPVSFTVAPPQTPFTVRIVNSMPFALQPSLYTGSNLDFQTPQNFYTNWGLGLSVGSLCPEQHVPAGACNTFNVTFIQGVPGVRPTVFTGLEALYQMGPGVSDVTWLAAQFWGSATNFVTFTPGSITGDLMPQEDSIWRGSYLETSAMILGQGNSYLLLNDSMITSICHPIDNAKTFLERSFVTQQWVVDHNCELWVADGGMSGQPSPFDIRDSGRLYYNQLALPLNNSVYIRGLNDSGITVSGSMNVLIAGGAPLNPMPAGRFDLVAVPSWINANAGVRKNLGWNTVQTPGSAVVFLTVNLTALNVPYGVYELQSRFNLTDGVLSVSRRRITYLPPGGADPNTHISSSAMPVLHPSSSAAVVPAAGSSTAVGGTTGTSTGGGGGGGSGAGSTGGSEHTCTGVEPPNSNPSSTALSGAAAAGAELSRAVMAASLMAAAVLLVASA